MPLYAGIDLHSNNLVLAILDGKGRRRLKRKLPNELGQASTRSQRAAAEEVRCTSRAGEVLVH